MAIGVLRRLSSGAALREFTRRDSIQSTAVIYSGNRALEVKRESQADSRLLIAFDRLLMYNLCITLNPEQNEAKPT